MLSPNGMGGPNDIFAGHADDEELLPDASWWRRERLYV